MRAETNVDLEHAGRAYTVIFADAEDGARVNAVVRSGQYLDKFSPICREVIAKARTILTAQGMQP